jgi:hypothetical protein
LVFTAVCASGVQAQATKSSGFTVPADEMSAIRAATEKYRDVKAAIADGYVLPMEMCVNSGFEGLPKQLGAMGLHYVRPDLLKITGQQPRVPGAGMHTDFLKPAVLIYEPQADGSQQLVAIENLVWAKAWKDAGNKGAPAFHGNEYFYMHDNPDTPVDEAHGFEPHYELHFWMYRENPSGMFAPFNPAVSCENFKAHEHK